MNLPSEVCELAMRMPGPAYIYDCRHFRATCRAFEDLPIERLSIFYATMANDHPAILREVLVRGHGVFVNSPRHLRLARSVGFPPERILYATANMVCEEMLLCITEGVRVILDSLDQIKLFGQVSGARREIGIRVNVGSALDRGALRDDPCYRFGLLPAELGAAVALAQRYELSIAGVHSYFGTGLMNPMTLLRGLKHLAEAAETLPGVRYIDVGGGFGIPDCPTGAEFDLKAYGEAASDIMREHERRLGRSLQLFIEPGRFLTARCGYFVVKVIDRKIRSDRVFVGTNGSVANFPRPLFHPDRAFHACEILAADGGTTESRPEYPLPIFIAGNSTFSGDFLARGMRMPLPDIGDTLVFHHAGAYCRSMITRFLGKDRPQELLIEPSAAARRAANKRKAAGPRRKRAALP